MKKYLSVLINCISAIILVSSLNLFFLNFSFNTTNNNLFTIPEFTKTDTYINLVNSKIEDAIKYISLKASFESDNLLNYDKVVAESIDDNDTILWTINDCLNVAARHGVYVDSDYNVRVNTTNSSTPFSGTTYNITNRYYPTKASIGPTSDESFIVDFMEQYAIYLKGFNQLSKNTNFYFKEIFYDTSFPNPIEISNTDITSDEFLSKEAFIHISSRDNYIISNIDSIDSNVLQKAVYYNPYKDKKFNLYFYVDLSFQNHDEFYESNIQYGTDKSSYSSILTIIMISLLIFIITFLFSFYYIFNTKLVINDSPSILAKVPTEIYLILYIIFTISLFIIINNLSLFSSTTRHIIPSNNAYMYALAIYITSLLLITILSTKYASGRLTPVFINYLREENKLSFTPPKYLFIMLFSTIIVFAISATYLLYFFTFYSNFSLLIISIILIVSIIFFTICLIYLLFAFEFALKEQKNANEMRTSLITNVSHDIKTPLTSIITYTDLISNEITKRGPKAKQNVLDYSQIVIDKSNRLNDLINDLIFDSKISTGNIKIEKEVIDLIEFINQINQEFIDKFAESNLKLIKNYPKKSINIIADSKQLYRVFQNLYTNIYKYALPNSQVFIDISLNKNNVIVTIKNIEKEHIQVDINNLKDRFVRGNLSRSTEGFGLGLSITDNLVKLMKGRFEISNVQDQFIAKLIFLHYVKKNHKN